MSINACAVSVLIIVACCCNFVEPEFTPVYYGVHVDQSLAFSVVFCRFLFIFSPFGHYIVSPSIYGFYLPLWYLQTFLITW